MSSRLLKWFAVSKQSQNKQVAQLSQKDRVAEWVSYSQKWKTGTGRQCLRTLVYLQPLWRNWPAKQSYSVKRMRNNGYYTAQGHSRSSRSVSIESPYANSNWHLIWYRFGVIAVYYSNFGHFAFLSHRWGGGLGTAYDVHLGKHVVDFLLVLIELFSLDVTVEALRAIIGSKLAISLQRGPVDPNFHVEGVAPTNLFFFSENYVKWFFVWYKNLHWFFFRLVTIHAFELRQTGRRTDRQNSHR